VTANRTTGRLLLVVLVMLLGSIGVILLTDSSSTPSAPSATAAGPHSQFDGPTIANGRLRAANFSLLDQNGHRVTLASYRGRVVILSFMHSLCHEACPLMAEQIKGALNSLPHGGSGIPAITISVDPAQDTRANRREFLANHQLTGRLEYLNGSRRVLRSVWHAYSVQPVTGNGKIDNHSAFVFLIDRRGFERVGFPVSELTPEGLAHDIGVLERERA
jgi:protein SCO1